MLDERHDILLLRLEIFTEFVSDELMCLERFDRFRTK